MFLFFLVTIFLILITSLIWFLIRLDTDLTLLFADKFGVPISTFKGKVIWIIGSSTGIGESLAYILALNGAKLILTATNEAKLESVKQKCLEDEDILVLPFDISRMEDHENHFKSVITKFNKLDILINNAARSQRAAFEHIEFQVDREIFEINVLGPVNLTRVALKYWYENKFPGHFVVTSSTAGKFGVVNSASYTGSKHALHGYFECLRNESFNKGIRVTMVCPGPVFSNVRVNARTGILGEVVGVPHPSNSLRMSSARCAHLMAVSMANKLDEAWISIQPALTVYYLIQYFPSLTRYILPRIMTGRIAHKFREG